MPNSSFTDLKDFFPAISANEHYDHTYGLLQLKRDAIELKR